MANIARMRCTWSGSGVVGPGLTTFYFDSAAVGFPAAAKSFFTPIMSRMPVNVSVTIPQEGDLIDPTTGTLTGVWGAASGGGTVTGSVTGNYPAGVGAQVRWKTGAIVGGRRVVGSTFLVPLTATCFDVNGTLTSDTVTGLQAAADALAASPAGLGIWSRPNVAKGRPGTFSDVVAAVVPDRVSWLRSRR